MILQFCYCLHDVCAAMHVPLPLVQRDHGTPSWSRLSLLPLCECHDWNSGHQGCGTSSFNHVSLAQGMIANSLTYYTKNNSNKTYLAYLNSVLRCPMHLYDLLRWNLVISWCSTNTYEIQSAFQMALYLGEVAWSPKGLQSIRGHGKYANSLL